MLKSLSIRNIALIDRADLEFSEGLNVLSGETGAGKSVILDSIDFVLGAKASAAMIRRGESECSVRAEFTLTEELKDLVRELDLDLEADDTLVLSRRFSSDGRGGAKVNGCAVSTSMLRRLTGRLVDVHGQSEHFYLLKESNQLRLLDKLAGEETEKVKEEVKALVKKRGDILAKRALLGGDALERSRRLDILRFQIEEIERAEIKEGEEEELSALRIKYRNAEKLLESLNGAREYLLSDGGGADCVGGARRALREISRYGDYSALLDRLDNALVELTDIGSALEELIGELDVDESEVERVENRLEEIHALRKKYGGSDAEVLTFLSCAREEYALLEDSGAQIEALGRELSSTEDLLYAACVRLTELRKKEAKSLSERVVEELKTLNIASAQFEVEFDDYCREDVSKATSEGLGGVRFLFSANAGEPLKELGKIISGGEMSRFMLAIKAQLSSVNGIGTYIFDEIDAGIGGKTAKVIAEKFCKLSKKTQIIAVSHLAQIAAGADSQFLIEKTEAAEKTFTQVKKLDGKERMQELARLLSGEVNELSLRHAEELFRTASIYKESL